MTRPGRYPPELRSGPSGWCSSTRRASLAVGGDHPIAHKFGVSSETLRNWVRG